TKERMFDVVAREDHERPLGGEIASPQRCANAADLIERVAVAELAPAGSGTLREKGARRSGGRPVFQALGQLRGVGGKHMRRSQEDCAVASALGNNVTRPEPHCAYRLGGRS